MLLLLQEGLPPPLPLHPTFAPLSRIICDQEGAEGCAWDYGAERGDRWAAGGLRVSVHGYVRGCWGWAWVVANGVGCVCGCVGAMVWREGWM